METIAQIKANLKPIKSYLEYKKYLKIIDQLIDCEENSSEEEVLELVRIIVESYENIHF